jgi:hypothetical protein
VGVVDAEAGTSTIFGGSLLEEGEVAQTFGGGYLDAFYQFDFANSRSFNLALRFRANFTHGFPFFGIYGHVSAPIRIGLIKQPASRFVRGKKAPDKDASPLSLAIHLTPGVFVGWGADQTVQVGIMFGATLGLGLMFSYQVSPTLIVNFGMDFPMFLSIEPSNARAVPLGFNLPMLVSGGVEYEVNESMSVFAKAGIGPVVYMGNMAGNIGPDDVAVHGEARLWLGLTWRR